MKMDIADADEISDWAYPAVITALAYSILELDEDGCVNPQGVVRLNEFMAMIN